MSYPLRLPLATKLRCATGCLLLALAACGNRQPANATAPPASAPRTAALAETPSCLPGERGYLQASLRGALEAELRWYGSELQCEGGARPDGKGLRLSMAGSLAGDGRRLRLVFGIAARPGENAQRAVPTNITAIVENGNRVYATLGDDKCAVEALQQQPLADTISSNGMRSYRVAARGYCVDPATTLDGRARLYINRFDLAAIASYEARDLEESTHGS